MHNKQLIKNNKQQFKPFIIGSVLIARHQHVKIRYMGSHFNPFSSAYLSVYVAGKTTNYYTYCWRKYSPIVVDKWILGSHTLNFSTRINASMNAILIQWYRRVYLCVKPPNQQFLLENTKEEKSKTNILP